MSGNQEKGKTKRCVLRWTVDGKRKVGVSETAREKLVDLKQETVREVDADMYETRFWVAMETESARQVRQQ